MVILTIQYMLLFIYERSIYWIVLYLQVKKDIKPPLFLGGREQLAAHRNCQGLFLSYARFKTKGESKSRSLHSRDFYGEKLNGIYLSI